MAGRVCYSGSWLLRMMKFSMPSTWRAMMAFLPSSDSRKAREMLLGGIVQAVVQFVREAVAVVGVAAPAGASQRKVKSAAGA